MTTTPRSLLAVVLAASGCGDNARGGGPLTDGDADASASQADAEPDGADDDGVVVFSNAEGAFVWGYWCFGCANEDSNYLDVTRAAVEQNDVPGPSSIHFFIDFPGISSPGGFRFRSSSDPDHPGTGANFATDEPFVIEGADDQAYTVVIPPTVKDVGDVVAAEDEWVTGEAWPYGNGGVQTAHFQDEAHCFGPDQVNFMSGVVGVRFNGDDGVHYGFVELAWDPPIDDYHLWTARYLPVRWGYNPVPDQPLIIPP